MQEHVRQRLPQEAATQSVGTQREELFQVREFYGIADKLEEKDNDVEDNDELDDRPEAFDQIAK
jgi:hypothetical protein